MFYVFNEDPCALDCLFSIFISPSRLYSMKCSMKPFPINLLYQTVSFSFLSIILIEIKKLIICGDDLKI